MSSASRRSKALRFPCVVVTWHDAWEDQRDLFEQDIRHEPKVQHTSGFLIRDNDRGVTLATEYGEEDGELRTTNFIPRGMIVKVKRLR